MQKERELKQLIREHVFIRNTEGQIGFSTDPNSWIFDFRQLVMNGRAANLISDIFYERFVDEYPFQICTLEIGGVPLATSIMNKFYVNGHTDINAFFIRKSRKKTGLHRMIEGQVQDEKKIILVDDTINSGNSFWRQVEVLEALGYKVDTVWTILRYRDESYYKRFHLRNIKIKTLFTLDDLSPLLGANIQNIKPKDTKPPQTVFESKWIFKSENPSLGWVCQKSQPVIDDQRIYFGSDNRIFWAINQTDGSVAWKFQVGPVGKKKAIFSNPALFKDSVIFGSYDGNVYCLNKETGELQWISFEGDWVGSSPAVAHDLGLVFIGLEYGLFTKLGGVIALDATTGKPVWIDRTHKALTHCSPHYIARHKQVIVGSNDGVARMHDARTGKIAWTFTTFGASDYDPKTWTGRRGYSGGDIKESFAYSANHDYVMFGAVDGFFYILERRTGHLVKHFKCEFGIFSNPFVYQNYVYFTSTDKRLRCINLDTLELVFEKNLDHTRIFSTPTVINDRLYVGTNAGRVYEIDPQTGKLAGYFQAIERITNTIVYNKDTDTYFLPTFANEIVALKRTAEPSPIDENA